MNKLLIFIATIFSLQASSQNEEALVIADSLYAMGNYKQAVLFYEAIPNSEVKLARSYELMGNATKALEFYKQAIDAHPNASISKYRYGKLLLNAGYLKLADSVFQKLARENPTQPSFRYHLGLVKEKKRDSTAIAEYELALELDSSFQNALYKVAKRKVEKREFAESGKFISQGLQVDPNSIRFLNLQALTHFYSKNYHAALATYKKLETLNQSNPQIHEHIAVCFANTNQFEASIDRYTILINEIDDTVAKWHYGIGNAYRALRYFEKAQRHFEIAIVLKDVSTEAEYLALAQLYGNQKMYKKQMEMFQNVIAENPNNQRAHYFFATAADNHFSDKLVVIPYYEKYLKRFGKKGLFSEFAKQRITDLKTDLHFRKD